MTTEWWQYREAGSYAGSVQVAPAAVRADGSASLLSAQVTVPQDARAGDAIHFIAGVSDDGSPTLMRYARFVLTVH